MKPGKFGFLFGSISAAAALIFSSCSFSVSDGSSSGSPLMASSSGSAASASSSSAPPGRKDYLRPWTIVCYAVADNSLDSYIRRDINEMEEGYSGAADVLAYVDLYSDSQPTNPVLYRITHDCSTNIVSPVIRSYDELDSCAGSNMRAVLQYAVAEYPSSNYGLILWSHGTGWLPPRYGWNASPRRRSFGQDLSAGGSEMDIRDLQTALEGFHFKYVLFDACYMADVEVAYQLRNCADYIISSQTEILSSGFPYRKVIGNLCAMMETNREECLRQVCADYFESYATNSGWSRSACVSLVRTGGLTNLSVSVSNMIAAAQDRIGESNMAALRLSVQKTSSDGIYSNLKYDLMDWMEMVNAAASLDKVFGQFQAAFGECVLYSTNTASFLGSLSLKDVHGLNVYIPEIQSNGLNDEYLKLDWSGESGVNLLIQ